MPRPGPEEHHEYYSTYIDKVPDEPILDVLRQAPDALDELLSGLSPADEHHAYAEGKWTLREAVGHVADTERIFAQRALHIAREDASPLPGMDQNVWAAASNAAQRPLASLLAEFRHQRQANVELFASFDGEILDLHEILELGDPNEETDAAPAAGKSQDHSAAPPGPPRTETRTAR